MLVRGIPSFLELNQSDARLSEQCVWRALAGDGSTLPNAQKQCQVPRSGLLEQYHVKPMQWVPVLNELRMAASRYLPEPS